MPRLVAVLWIAIVVMSTLTVIGIGGPVRPTPAKPSDDKAGPTLDEMARMHTFSGDPVGRAAARLGGRKVRAPRKHGGG